jgi:2-keto-3-deoxy-L-rhamnonate aldolase RhmA
VAETARRAGKIPCTLAITGDSAKRFRDIGFRLIALGGDFGYLTAGATALLEASKG